MTKFILRMIVVYKKYSRVLWCSVPGFLTYSACRFYPTCAEYGYDVIDKQGLRAGLPLAIRRVLRCNPFTKIA